MPIWSHNGLKWQQVNLHKKSNGLSAFLCAGGPSLNHVNPAFLNGPNRLVFGLNNTYPTIKPDYWIGMDDPDCYDVRLFWEPFPKIMRGGSGYSDGLCRGFALRDLNNVMFADVVEHSDNMDVFNMSEKTKFIWHKNTFSIALQVIMWMGIKNIYLFGVDLNNDSNDYFDGTYLTKEQRDSNSLLYNQLYNFLKKFKSIAEPLGYRIVSCSHGSRVNDLFEYKHYMDVIKYLEIDVPFGRIKNHVLETTTSKEKK
jgi:hypothetical protein